MKKSKKSLKFDRIDWKMLLVFLFISYFVSYIGSGFTVIDDWYYSVKPSITPPNIVFPIVWGILFFLIGLSFYYSYISNKKLQHNVLLFYSINYALNVAWSFFFFTLHNVFMGLVIIILLILSILQLIMFNWNKKRIAGYLLIPYLIWVCFASILNLIILINSLR